jgi:two-component system OmpR family sensor kinase
VNRLPLRRSLLWGTLALTAAALAVAGVTSAFALRDYLVERTDDQLRVAAVFAEQRADQLLDARQSGGGLLAILAPSDYVVEVHHISGVTRFGGLGQLPARPLLDSAPAPPAVGVSPPATVADGTYRAVTVRARDAVVLVALPLAPVRQTVARLAVVELLAGAVVLFVQGALARMLLARGLRPLERITATATALAGGDLDRRVPEEPSPPRTEVGRLSAAVNGMLGRIQTALAARARSEERLRRFLADASHELRTPLTSIRGYVQLLRGGMVPADRHADVLRRTDEETTRMAVIVDDLLYLARLDAEQGLRRESVDLVAVARDSLSDALAVQPGRPAEFVAGEPCAVVGDPDALRQVLANLLANVRAHTPPDAAVRVTVAPDGEDARVTVADAGPGIAPEVAARAFDRFSRGDPGGPGSGLGLAIVAEIVAAHGGTVTIGPGPDGGTTTAFTVPQGRGRSMRPDRLR